MKIPYSNSEQRIGEHPINPQTGQRYNPGNIDDPNHPNNFRNRHYLETEMNIDRIGDDRTKYEGNKIIGEHPINPQTGQRYNPGNIDDPNHPNNPRGIRRS